VDAEQLAQLKQAAMKAKDIGNRWPRSREEVDLIAQFGSQDAELIALANPQTILDLIGIVAVREIVGPDSQPQAAADVVLVDRASILKRLAELRVQFNWTEVGAVVEGIDQFVRALPPYRKE